MATISLQLTETENETERHLAGIWREFPGLESVGFDQNLFDLGGTYFDNATSTLLVLGRIWQLNDQACWQICPSHIEALSQTFRLATQYRIFNKPDLKWDRLAQGGQEVVVSACVYPATMLLSHSWSIWRRPAAVHRPSNRSHSGSRNSSQQSH